MKPDQDFTEQLSEKLSDFYKQEINKDYQEVIFNAYNYANKSIHFQIIKKFMDELESMFEYDNFVMCVDIEEYLKEAYIAGACDALKELMKENHKILSWVMEEEWIELDGGAMTVDLLL